MPFLQDADAMQTQLQEQLSVAEGLNTAKDVFAYVNRICESLEAVGYEVPSEFTLGDLIATVEDVIETKVSKLDEDMWGDHVATQKKKSFFGRAVGAVKGAVKRGVASVNTKMRRYHAAKADKALDVAANTQADPKDSDKAAKHYVKHYVKAQAYAKKLNPASHAQTSKDKMNDFGIKHGSPEDAKHRLDFARTLDPLHHAIKADAPMQANAAAMKRKAQAAKSGSHTAPTVKMNNDPEAKTNAIRVKIRA